MASVEGPELIRPEPVTETDPKHLPTVSIGPLINELALSDKADGQARPAFEIEEHPIDEIRPIKVGVIGAGLAGITAGVLLPAKLPGLDLRIYEKNSGVVSNEFESHTMHF